MSHFAIDFSLLNKFQDACFIISEDGDVHDSNDAGLRILNINRKNIEEINLYDLIDPRANSKTILTFTKLIENNTAGNLTLTFTNNKVSMDLEVFVTPFHKNSQEEPKKFFIIARNITQEKEKEVELLRFYNVVERSIFPVQITNVSGDMIYVNQAFIDTSGFAKEELLGKNPRVFGSGKHSSKFWGNMWETISSGKVWVGEVEDRRKDGEAFYTQLMISPIFDNKHRIMGYFAIHRDLSDKKLLEKQLVHSQKMESIGTLAAGIAHEVGNPLASISALVQVILRSSDDALLKERLGLIKHQVNRISKIIRDLVNFSRPSNYELKLVDVNQLLEDTINITKVGKKAKDIMFEKKLSDMIPPIPLIPDQIEQVFLNMFINAVDALNEKKGGVKNIIVESYMVDETINIKISDSGVGIKEEHFSKVFEPFFTTKKEGRGTGLGLWVSYGIVKSFEGNIEVESKEGKGTIFLIKLPIKS